MSNGVSTRAFRTLQSKDLTPA